MKKSIAAVLAFLLAMLLLTSACRNNATPTPAPSSGTDTGLPEVSIDWYTGLGLRPDTQMVNDAVNEYLKDTLNVKVNFIYMVWDDWNTRMGPLFASGQDMGVVAFGSQAQVNYLVQANQGSYAPLDDLLTQHAPRTKALFPDAVWNGMKVNGNIYGIPSLKDNCYIMTVIYNKTMADAIGVDMSGVTFRNFMDEGVEELLLEVMERRNEWKPEFSDRPILWGNTDPWPYCFAVEVFVDGNLGAVCNIPGLMELSGYDANTVFNLYSTPEYMEYAKQRQRFVELGINAFDYQGKEDWQYEGSIFGYNSWGHVLPAKSLYSTDFDVELIPPARTWTETMNYMSAGVAISSNCANKDRAMMLINAMNTDPVFATMMRFGIEGEHYIKDSSGAMQLEGSPRNSDPSNMGFLYWYAAPLGNLTIVNAPPSYSGPDNIMLKMIDDFNKSTNMPSHMGFVFNQEPVVTEIAACQSIIVEYNPSISQGILASAAAVEARVDDFNAKLMQNGLQKIQDEITKQLSEWK